jgi:excisionase family DNA binding protein
MNRSKLGLLKSEAEKEPYIFGEALRKEIKSIVKESLLEVLGAREESDQPTQLLTPDDLAKRFKVPVSWVYERSRQNKIPTRRIGRYVRFQLREVLDFMKQLST